MLVCYFNSLTYYIYVVYVLNALEFIYFLQINAVLMELYMKSQKHKLYFGVNINLLGINSTISLHVN